ncbi:MAG TPA: g-type lysozyme inhibitor [Pseudomonas sp.]|nr:g-type lysozyme inhibitor [Pseudomonas sp.]
MKPALLLSLALAFSAGNPALAKDTVTTVPVQFAKGASSSVLKGQFSGYDSVRYTLGAKAGQSMTVRIKGSRNANFNVFAPGASTALGGGSVGSDWSAVLPDSGEYRVEVYQMRASARRGEKVEYSIEFGVK